jgi:gamma-glutamyltranspeptidase / glutathione hydrolase / leukotriene-C4 hydrolase
MDDFSTPGTVNTFNVPASEANFIKPRKKPMSSMSPIIIVDNNDNVRLVLGASGGTKIITAVSYVALHNLWLNYNIKDAIDKNRLHHQLSPSYVEVERGFSSDIQELLKLKGHKLKCFNYGGSTVQGIERRPNDELWANCDARKGGEPDGF